MPAATTEFVKICDSTALTVTEQGCCLDASTRTGHPSLRKEGVAETPGDLTGYLAAQAER